MYRRALGVFIASFVFAVLGFAGQALADSSTLIGMVSGGDIYVKAGSTTASWSTRLTTGEDATQLQMYGTRIAFVDGSNDLWLKDGLFGQWYEEMGNVQSYALTETGLLVLQTGGDVWYKAGEDPTAQWDTNLIANNGAKVYLSPNQMAIIDTSGNLLGKSLSFDYYNANGWGPESSWLVEAHNATSAALSDTVFAYLNNQGQTFAKVGVRSIASAWVYDNGPEVIDNRATAVWVSGNTYCALLSGSTVACKIASTNGDDPGDSLQTAESQVFGDAGATINSFAIAPNMFLGLGNLGDGNNYIYGMDYSSVSLTSSGYDYVTNGWGTVSTTGSEIATNQE